MFFKPISQHVHKQLNWNLLLRVSSKEEDAEEASQTEQTTVAGQNSAQAMQ